MTNLKHTAGSFQDDPALFVESIIKEFVRSSTSNSLRDLDDGPMFDEPLVGFADGDDPIFQQYKTLIGAHHFTPKEALGMYCESKGFSAPTQATVVSFIMPIARETKLANRQETQVGCLAWNRTRWNGQDFIYALSRHVASALEELGYRTVVPELESFHKVDVRAFTSTWSQRHMAYAAGLGTFGLTDGFLSPKGLAIRCGSVVTEAVVQPTPRTYRDHYAACLFYQDKSCRRCIERCPAGAISEQGHDKQKCVEYLVVKQKEIVRQLGREGQYIGLYPGCGLCQTKVPCESGLPKSARLDKD